MSGDFSFIDQKFISIFSNIHFLFEFEPNVNEEQIQKVKKKFNSLQLEKLSIEELLSKFKDFPVFLDAISIVNITLSAVDELQKPNDSSTKEMQRFKTNRKYLTRYINSFADTAQLYKQLNRNQDAEELEEIVNIFKAVRSKQTRHETIQWLITEYLTYIMQGDISYQEVFPNLSSSLTKERDAAIQRQLSRRVNIYLSYFDGLDISKEDIYRSMLIKLYYLYNQYGANQGRGSANPNNHIEIIVGTLQNKNIKISPAKMKNVYIKGFFNGVAILDYKTRTDQVDAIDEYFKIQRQSPLVSLFPYTEGLIADQRQSLLNELILL